MKTYVATKNLGKLEEMHAIFAGTEIELDTYPLYAEAPEPEQNYAGNAESKARALHEQLHEAGVHGAVLSDDSGIEVAALGGRPGRAFGAVWRQRRNVARAPRETVGGARERPPGERSAKFCCAMMLLLEDGESFTGYGEVEGLIPGEEQGRFGFGYDPIFYYPPESKTFAQLDESEKNRLSHRRRAAEALLAAFRARG